MTRVSAHGISLAYGSSVILDRLSVEIATGEVLGVMGPSGSGKSSLLRVLSGLQVPDAGSVSIAGTDLTGLSVSRRADVRRRSIGQVFQEPQLLPELSVVENVALTVIFDGVPRREALARAERVLDQLGVSEHADKTIDRVSGGQAQRVALARALVREDIALLLADEPTASLDADNALAVGRLIVSTARDRRIAVLLATHDPAIGALCDRVLRLRQPSVAA